MKRITGLHAIVGGTDDTRTLELAALAQAEGAAVVQYRDKFASDEKLLDIAQKLRSILNQTTFIVNDRPDIALAAHADGVHLGQEDMTITEARAMLGPNAIIGVSTSKIDESLVAEREGANYLGFGHMFLTLSKEKASQPRTRQELSAVVATVSIPVIAIGGITEENVSEILVPGFGGIAVISAINNSTKPRETIRNFVKILEERHAIYA